MSDSYERRCGKDRRQEDCDFSGNGERRRTVESRKPEITEIQLSDNDWKLLFGAPEATTSSIEVSVILGDVDRKLTHVEG